MKMPFNENDPADFPYNFMLQQKDQLSLWLIVIVIYTNSFTILRFLQFMNHMEDLTWHYTNSQKTLLIIKN